MKKIISLCLLLTLTVTMLCCLSGCGIKPVEISQLEKDLNLCNEIQDCFASEYADASRYQVTDCIIVENKLDEEKVKNTIFSNVTVENNYFQVLLDVKTVYYYYDKNGWVLNEVSYDLDDVKALNGPNTEQIKSVLEDLLDKGRGFSYGIPHSDNSTSYYYLYSNNNDFNVIDVALSENGKSAKVNCCYESDGTKFYGYYKIYFDKTGWHFSEDDLASTHMILTESDFNYSERAVGSFYDSYEDEYTHLVIHKIENGAITYSLKSNDSIILGNNFKQGENLTAEFNYKTGEFIGFHYDTEEDIWEFGAVELKRS